MSVIIAANDLNDVFFARRLILSFWILVGAGIEAVE